MTTAKSWRQVQAMPGTLREAAGVLRGRVSHRHEIATGLEDIAARIDAFLLAQGRPAVVERPRAEKAAHRRT